VVVKPGDIVIGDRDGVVVVPTAQAEEVLALATGERGCRGEDFGQDPGWRTHFGSP